MSSLACKCVFYGPEHNAESDRMKLNFEVVKKQKRNIPTDRAQRADEKNKVICPFIVFTSRVIVIRMSKNCSFYVFSADDSKKLITAWERYLIAPKRSYWILSENVMFNSFWS